MYNDVEASPAVGYATKATGESTVSSRIVETLNLITECYNSYKDLEKRLSPVIVFYPEAPTSAGNNSVAPAPPLMSDSESSLSEATYQLRLLRNKLDELTSRVRA